jgi:signal transduction histidine kinase
MDLSNATLGGLRASGHLCFLYESEDERRRTLVAFFREGLTRHERCQYIGAAADQEAFALALEEEGVPAERALARGALVFATQAETYRRSGRFDPDDSLALMEEVTDRALADGFAGLRVTGEASGPLPDELWPLVMRYEALLNERLGRRPFVGLCRFHASDLSAERLQDVLRTHPHALVRGEVCVNPFYERPEVVLSGDSRARLDWQLHQLRSYHRARKRLESRSAAAAGEAEVARGRSRRARNRVLSVLADELADPLFALKREVHALGAALDETPAPERLEAAQRHLRRLSAAVEQARDAARLLEREGDPSDEVALALESVCDLGALVREAAALHAEALAAAGAALSVDAPEPLPGSWERDAVQRLVSTFLRGVAARGARRPVTIAVRPNAGLEEAGVGSSQVGGATLTFSEGPEATVELPLSPRRTRGT